MLQPAAKMLRHSHKKTDLSCFKSLLVTGLWDITLTSLLPPIQSCCSKFWAWSWIASNFDKGWRGDHKHKVMDRLFMSKYGTVSQVLLQLVVARAAMIHFLALYDTDRVRTESWIFLEKVLKCTQPFSRPGKSLENRSKAVKKWYKVLCFFKATTSASLVFFLKLQHVLHKWNFVLLVKSYSILPASHGKSFVPAFFKVSVDHLFYNLESGKRNYCFWKSLEKVLKFGSKICTNPVQII